MADERKLNMEAIEIRKPIFKNLKCDNIVADKIKVEELCADPTDSEIKKLAKEYSEVLRKKKPTLLERLRSLFH